MSYLYHSINHLNICKYIVSKERNSILNLFWRMEIVWNRMVFYRFWDFDATALVSACFIEIHCYYRLWHGHLWGNYPPLALQNLLRIFETVPKHEKMLQFASIFWAKIRFPRPLVSESMIVILNRMQKIVQYSKKWNKNNFIIFGGIETVEL